MAQIELTDWATSDIADIGNGDPNKQPISATLKTDGWGVVKPDVQDMNQILHLLSRYSRANNEIAIRSTGYESSAGELVIADNSAASCTIKLPALPITGQWVLIQGAVKFSTFSVIVDGNSNDIMIAADQTCTLDIDDRAFLFSWDGSKWLISIYGVNGRIL